MKLQEMNDIVKKELRHIPRGDGPRHGWLRNYYNRRRRQGLSKGKTKEESLLECINEIRKEDPKWHPEFDITFFKIGTLPPIKRPKEQFI